MNVTAEMLSGLSSELGEGGEPLTTHDVLRLLSLRHAREYILDLYDQRNAENPFRTTHGLIGRRMAEISILEKVERMSDTNIRGHETENQLWRLRRSS